VLRFNVDELTDEYAAAGLDPEEARQQALLKLGNSQRIRELVREMSWGRYLTDLFRDLRFALRSLRKAGHISLVAVVALALGIGFSAAVFGVVYNCVLRPLPYRSADRQVSIEMGDPKSDESERQHMFPLENIAAFRGDKRDLEDAAGYSTWYIRYLHDDGAEMLRGGALAQNALEFFGMRPILDLSLIPTDSQPGAEPVVLLNYHFWKERFNGDRSALGSTLLMVPALRSQLWGASALDGITFALVALLLLGAGMLASFLPALKAVRVDPNSALRSE
jgi:putative ABC transport system permease protein